LAHFAQIENNMVTRVIVVSNKDTSNEEGVEIEQIGIDFCSNLLGGTWLQTSYNGNIRKNYAGIGYTYDKGRDAFIAPKPYNSWLLDEYTCRWKAPIPYPNDKHIYKWDETILNWVAISNEGKTK
jgi:hypothetical protein